MSDHPRIRSVRCVQYSGVIEADEPFVAGRPERPVDVYPERAADGPDVAYPLRRLGDGRWGVDAIFVHVEADDGVSGTAGPIGHEQAVVIARTKAPLLIGADALATERAWDLLYRHAVHGRKGLEMMALSALDCALWDLKGRWLGQPVHRLLGGPTRDAVPVYASTLGHATDPEAAAELAARLTREGFRATKWFPRWRPQHGEAGVRGVHALVEAIRDASGDGAEIMLDAWMSWDVPFTLAVARRVAGHGVRWIEEPVMPDQRAAYAEIARRLDGGIAVAGGEHEYTRWGIAELLRDRAVQVCQPDTYWAGGITEMCRIAALTSTAGIPLIPHGHSVAANAALTFAQPEATMPMLEYLLTANVIRQHFLAHPLHPVDGVLRAPTEPGLGMRLDESKIERRVELRLA
ncbi:MAG TPA: enolase C-terminal domain-like protein [Capillimicrobium sp.]|nr:enolase C-terminal domain-like protein [Capillimicrobium sp.]